MLKEVLQGFLRFVLFHFVLLSHYHRHYRRSIRTASPIHLISRPTSLPTHYIGLQVWNALLSSLPLSPRLSTGVITYSTTYHPMPNVFYFLLLLLYATVILKDKAGVRDDHGKGWNAEGHDTWRRVRMVSGNAYKEYSALDQE